MFFKSLLVYFSYLIAFNILFAFVIGENPVLW